MAQYQSFPDANGDSQSLAKLKSLRLPSLVGRRFLDVGCNEGFFCGYAHFTGAAEVVGVDASADFLTRARRRFPTVRFFQQDWQVLPQGSFDVVLLASALHYASDQADLIHRLMAKLAPGGTLVLELGIAPGDENVFVEVDRGIDRRSFPTYNKLMEILLPYAWKFVGESVSQAGDPVSRQVFHIQQRQPFAYLLVQPPGSGKSVLARELFAQAGVRVIAGDGCLNAIATGKLAVSSDLLAAVEKDFSSQLLAKKIDKLMLAGLLPELLEIWIKMAEGRDFALDCYLPAAVHETVTELLNARGYISVKLDWRSPSPCLATPSGSEIQAEMYRLHLQNQANGQKAPMPDEKCFGHLDIAEYANGVLKLYGWAIRGQDRMVDVLLVKLGEDYIPIAGFDRHARPDVQKHLNLPHDWYGYCISIALPKGLTLEELPEKLKVYAGVSGQIPHGPLALHPRNGLTLVVKTPLQTYTFNK